LNNFLLLPPIAFLIYVAIASILFGIGRFLAGKSHPNHVKSSAYASGEEAIPSTSAPGYRPFFKVALFFAVLHLGVIILGTGDISTTSVVYPLGLMVALLALILG